MSALAQVGYVARRSIVRTSRQPANIIFPFVFLLVSSMNFPRNLIEATWFRWLATANPVSYLIEGLRSLIIEGWNWQALGLAFGFAAVLAGAAMVLANWALQLRLTRT